MSNSLQDFMQTSVALHELREGVVGKMFQMMQRLGVYEVDRQESKLAWNIIYYMHHYCKASLKKVMVNEHVYDVLKSRITADKQKYP